jgi:tetratricopeptide (TPR) repeat protein
MTEFTAVTSTDAGPLIAGRYQIEQILGQGGMGTVYRAADTATRRHIALKLLTINKSDAKPKHLERLARFEREYYTLAQLAHPRIIDVYDYGLDATGAYYTMELLDGGDLRDRAPMSWKRACALLRDVASALALIHSRRMVHRDLSPRNVRYTSDGFAKLFDFGSLAPMGPCKSVLGTPPCTPPEMINHQALDARADLYALGATAYYVLTGRNAYPARSFAQLRDIWRSRPIPPSDIVDMIPPALDSLVMSLLSLNLVSRPSSAAEVIERLNAIAGADPHEEHIVSRAYLVTPSLVGRDDSLLQIRKRMIRALIGQGSSILVQGVAGVGRSRFLDASVLEGKLAGATVLRADACDAWTGDYGVARALIEQLWEKAPDVAYASIKPHAGVLGHVFPELREKLGDIELCPIQDLHEIRARVQVALRIWLLELSHIKPLALIVDDLHLIDEPSAAFLTALGYKAPSSNLVLITTAEAGAKANAPTSVKLFSEYSESIILRGLSADQIESLLRSIFGDVPNVKLLSDWLFKLCEGNPRTAMELAQHLVDSGTVRYESGRWILPNQFSDRDLPISLWVALEKRMHALSPDARELAELLSLGLTEGLSPRDYCTLTEHRDIARLYRAFDELVASQILGSDGHGYRFSQQTWPTLFMREVTAARLQQLHRLIGELFATNGRDQLRAAHHLIASGDHARGFDFLIVAIKNSWKALESGTENMDDYLHAKSPYFSTLLAALTLCDQLNRRKRDYYLVLNAVVLVGHYADRMVALKHIPALFDLLYRASGLDIWQELDPALSAEERLNRALTAAQERYERTSHHERTIPPLPAIAQLARLQIQVAGMASTLYDLPLLESIPSMTPLVPLSPALGMSQALCQSIAMMISGRLKPARLCLLDILTKIGERGSAVTDQIVYHYLRLGVLHALARIEAEMGLESALMRADALDVNPLHQVNGWWARMTYYLCFGDKAEAEQCRARAELLQIQNSPLEVLEGVNLTNQLLSYARAEDLMGVKIVTEQISDMAKSYKGWVPYHYLGLGEHYRIRGDFERSLAEFERALELTEPGRHLAWQWAAGSRVRVLEQLGRNIEAKTAAQDALAVCEKAQILPGYGVSDIIHGLALAEARLGEYKTAVERMELLIAGYREDQVSGLPLGLAYETRARIAIWMADREAFRSYSELIVELPGCGHSVTLTTRYQKLMAEGARANMGLTSAYPGRQARDNQTATVRILLERLIALNPEPAERARRAFELLVEQSGALGGYLFLLLDRPRLVRHHGQVTVSAGLEQMVSQYLRLDGANSVSSLDTLSETDSRDEGDENDDWVSPQGERYRQVLLGARKDYQFVMVGMVALRAGPAEPPRIFWDVVNVLSNALLEAGESVIGED